MVLSVLLESEQEENSGESEKRKGEEDSEVTQALVEACADHGYQTVAHTASEVPRRESQSALVREYFR